jgi:predicted nucleic acid-binding protein
VHLGEVDALDLLFGTGSVLLPHAVDLELRAQVPGWPLSHVTRFQIVDLDAAYLSRADDWVRSGIIHAGEAAAIALARQTSWIGS